MTTQYHVSQAEVVFKHVCGEDSDFLKCMEAADEEEDISSAAATAVMEAASATPTEPSE
jgi:hypothetical protein